MDVGDIIPQRCMPEDSKRAGRVSTTLLTFVTACCTPAAHSTSGKMQPQVGPWLQRVGRLKKVGGNEKARRAEMVFNESPQATGRLVHEKPMPCKPTRFGKVGEYHEALHPYPWEDEYIGTKRGG